MEPLVIILTEEQRKEILASLSIEELEELLKSKKEAFHSDILNRNIQDLDLSSRALNALKSANLLTVRKVVDFGIEQIPFLRNIGPETMKEIEEKIFARVK